MCLPSDEPVALPPYPSARTLRALHIAAAGLHACSFALALGCATGTSIGTPVWTNSIRYELGPTQGYVQFSDRSTVFIFHQQRVILAFVAVTAVAHCFYAALPEAGARGNPYRWLEYGITATMLTLSSGVSVGASSIDAFVFMLALSVMLQGTGLGLDLVHSRPVAGMRELLLSAGFVAVTALVVILSWHTHTAAHVLVDTCRVGSAYGIYYLSFGVAAALRAYNIGMWRGAAWTEFVYVMLSLSSKTSIFWLSFGGIRQMVEHLNADEHKNGANWHTVQSAAAYGPGAVAVVGILLTAAAAPRRGKQLLQ